MSGYFSRIARQGGARIAGNGGPRPGTAAKTESHLAPIDHEETVMVPPRASADVPASRRPVVTDQTRGQKTAKQSTTVIDPATEISPPKAKRPAPLEPIREEVRIIEPATSQGSSHASPAPEEKKIETLKPIESAKQIPSPPRTAETPPPEKSTEKKFFEKTVEIVEGQTAKPAEVHTILLREVQEWIAAADTASHEVIADVADLAAEPIPDTSLPREREPGVVRIVEGRRAKASPELVHEVPMTNLSEQTFELSIGSISVVVEGDERQPAAAPVQVAVQPARQETPQRTSRLSRHYL